MKIHRHLAILSLSLSVSLAALPCTCVAALNSTAKTQMEDVSVVFRGTVIERKTLPQRLEMKARGRYAIRFHVDEYWKGAPGRIVILYGLDDGTDCRGGGLYEVGKNYLVYASEQEAKDVILDGRFWYGWTDVLREGVKMLVPTACKPGGETAAVRKAIRELGTGRRPAKAG